MKFRTAGLPPTLLRRPVLQRRLTAGAGKRLTVVVGSAGAGKSVLLADWAAARPAARTFWLACDRADADPVRFWAAFIEAPRVTAPEFGADAGELLAMDAVMSADVTASIANDAARLPAGSVFVVDDFHFAAGAAGKHMIDLVEHWPADTVQLVLASRFDPALRQHRLRMSGKLCELRDADLYFSQDEIRDLLANFDVEVDAAHLELLHQRTEGWPAAVQMAALSLRGATDPDRIARALEVRSHTIADYFISEVLDQQPPEVAQFMLDTSVLGQLTADACAVVTGRPDAEALLRAIDIAHLFLVALDGEPATFRYHRLVRQVLHAELRARDRDREHLLHQRAAEWYEAAGDTTRATRHFFAANQAGRALELMQDRVVTDFLQHPVVPGALDLAVIAPAALAHSPDQLLTVAADLLIHGNVTRAGDYLDVLRQTQEPGALAPRPAFRLAALQCFYYALTGAVAEAEGAADRARAVLERTGHTDEWDAAVPLIMLRVYASLGDVKAVARETDAALAAAGLTEPAKLVELPGAQALACFEAGHLAAAAGAARAAGAAAAILGFERHFFAVDYLRALAGLALEQRDIDTAERLTEQTISITEHQRPIFEFLALLDRAAIWAARGQTPEALASVNSARDVLPGARSALLARADETEALLRLSLGDLDSPATLATRLPVIPRTILLARIALAAGDHHVAQEHLQSPSINDLTPRRALVRQVLLAATAIERGDPVIASIVGGVLQAARGEGFINTVVTTAPQVTSYLIEHSTQLRQDAFVKQLIAAALGAHAMQPRPHQSGDLLAAPLTPAELRILRLLPTSTYLQMADTLYVSRNTVKTHLRSIYQKLGVESRSQAIERAVELRLL